jgi:hypothetical protein
MLRHHLTSTSIILLGVLFCIFVAPIMRAQVSVLDTSPVYVNRQMRPRMLRLRLLPILRRVLRAAEADSLTTGFLWSEKPSPNSRTG